MSRQSQFARNLQKFRLVTFDVTDTLLGFKTPPAIQYAKTATALGVHNIDQKLLTHCFRQEFKAMAKLHPNFGCTTENMSWQQWWTQLVCNIFRCADATIPPEKLQQIADKLLKQYRTRECWTEMEGATELVHRIKNSGKCVGVISNSDPSVRQVLHEMEMKQFDFVLTSYDCGVQKPNTRIFQIPLENFKIDASQALHIGNLYDIDYLGAKKSGWSSLLVTPERPQSGDLQNSHVYHSLKDLIKALETNEIQW